jgi:endonuclease YncB( thermonuclease family)
MGDYVMPRILRNLCLAALLVVVGLGTLNAKNLAWQTGTLEQITSDERTNTVGTMFNGRAVLKQRSVTTTHYLIRGAQYIYQADRGTNTGEKSLEVTIHGPVEFAVDGSTLYLRDEKGKEHKLALISKALP